MVKIDRNFIMFDLFFYAFSPNLTFIGFCLHNYYALQWDQLRKSMRVNLRPTKPDESERFLSFTISAVQSQNVVSANIEHYTDIWSNHAEWWISAIMATWAAWGEKSDQKCFGYTLTEAQFCVYFVQETEFLVFC